MWPKRKLELPLVERVFGCLSGGVKEFLVSELRRVVEAAAREFEPGVLGLATVEAAVGEWAAIERVALNKKLRGKKATADAFDQGRLSPTQANAIAGCAATR
jgi:hypothetical protein